MTSPGGPVRPAPITGHTAVYALFGQPARHSASPSLYNPLFAALGIDAVYVVFEAPREAGPQLPGLIRTLGLAGANLTVPFKAEVLDGLDTLEPLARALGAVNVVYRGDDGALVGANTDGEGFVRALHRETPARAEGLKAVVLGAGGAGRAVGLALASAGAREVVFLNRTEDRADEAVRRGEALDTGATLRADRLSSEAFARHAPDAGLVVMALSGPGAAGVEALPLDTLAPGAVWSDLNYWMAEPPGFAELGRRGVIRQTGHGMLAGQAVGALERFVGQTVELDTVRALLR